MSSRARDPLPAPATVIETLRAVPMPGNADPSLIFPERLVEIAVIASENAAATSRLEIYQRGLDADRALRLAAGRALRRGRDHAEGGGTAGADPLPRS